MSAPPPFAFPPPAHPNDHGIGPLVMGMTWTFTIIATVAISLRLYLCKKGTKATGLDDWLMLAAVVFQLVFQSLISTSYHFGMGKHDADIEMPGPFVNVLKFCWLGLVFGMAVSITARISIALLLVRLFGGVHKWFKWFTIVLTTTQTIVGTAIIPIHLLQVQPTEGLWDVFRPGVTRWDPRIVIYLEYFLQALYTLSDLAYVLLPVMIVWSLHMALHRKVGLIVMLGMSLFTVALSILKAVWIGRQPTVDAQYSASLAVMWAGLEQAFVIIMGCVPPLRGILKDIPGLAAVTASLYRFVRWNTERTTKTKSSHSSRSARSVPSGKNGDVSAGVYLDLERSNHHHLNSLGGVAKVEVDHRYAGEPVVTYYPSAGSQQSLVTPPPPPPPPMYVRRTDQYTVSYDARR